MVIRKRIIETSQPLSSRGKASARESLGHFHSVGCNKYKYEVKNMPFTILILFLAKNIKNEIFSNKLHSNFGKCFIEWHKIGPYRSPFEEEKTNEQIVLSCRDLHLGPMLALYAFK